MEFYGVIGANGVTVMNDWNRVLQASKYLRKITTHKFDTFEEAEDWALTQFADRFPRANTPLSLSLNWVVYTKDCMHN